MKGLLYKELVQNKAMLAVMGFACVFLSVALGIFPFISDEADVSDDTAFTMMIMMFVSILDYFILFCFQGNFIQADELKKWAYFITSTPETAEGQIRSKYFLIVLCDMAVLIWTYVFETIANIFQGSQTGIISVSALLFFLHLFLSAFDLPFMIRFGTKGGNMAHTITLLILVAVAGIYFLFGDLSIFGTTDQFFDKIMKFLNGENSDGSILILGLFVWASAGCYYLSYKLSCRFYLKGVEYYAK